MQNALKMSFGITKRAFTIAVVVTTLAWSVAATFAIAPRVASAATPAAGSLVKGSLSAVYYIGSDGKRYVFTNDKEYFTWYSDFSSVQKISDTDLAAIMIGGNVTYKPGVKMVKIQSDPKVYAVAHGGVLRWVSTEAAATALYGSNWNTKIDDISDAFFTNYTVGSQISSASDFVIANEQTNSPTINADKGLAGGGALNITLASDNAAGATVTANAQGINLIKFNVAGTGTLTGLTFTRLGAGVAADWANVYLYDGDTRLTTGRSVSSTTNQVSFSNLNVAISGTKELTLVGDLVVAGGRVGDAHYFSLVAATDVVASATVGGTFPVSGNQFSISGSNGGSITVSAGSPPSSPSMGQTAAELTTFKLTAGGVEDVSLRRLVITNSGAGQLSNLANMAITTGGVTVASNPIVSGSTATFVFAVPYLLAKGITRTFSVIGDVSAGNRATVDTFHLYVDQPYDIFATGNTYGAGVNVTDDFSSNVFGAPATFDANNGNETGSFLINILGGQITFASNGPATGDISVGSNDAVIQKFAITSVNHVEVRNLNMRLTASGVLSTGANSEEAAITDCKIINSDTGVTVTNSYDLANWTQGGNPVFTRLFTDRFEIAAGQTINLALTCDIASSAPATLTGVSLTGQVDARAQGDIRNLDSNLDVAIGDIVPASALTGNPQTVRSSGLTVGLASSPASQTVTKGSTVNAVAFNFTAGSASDVKVTQMKFRGFTDVDAGGDYASNGTAAAPVSGENHPVADVIQSASIWDGSTQLGTAQSPDATGDMNFSNLTWSVPAGTTKTVTVKVIVSNNVPYSGVSDAFLVDLIGDGSAQVGGVGKTANVTAQDKDSNSVNATSAGWSNADYHLQQAAVFGAATTMTSNPASIVVTAVRSGTLQVQIDGDTPVSSILTGSTSDNAVTRLKFNSVNEGFNVTRLTVVNTNPGSSQSITSVRLFDNSGTLFCSGTLDSSNRLRCANDAGLFTVSGNQVVTVKLNIDQIGSATSGGQPIMALYVANGVAGDTYADDIKAVGISSGTALLDTDVRAPGDTVASNGIAFANAALKVYAPVGTLPATPYVINNYWAGTTPIAIPGNVSLLKKTQPTVATVAVSTTLTPNPTVYKFSVTADSNADVALKRFDLAESNVLQGSSGYLLYENDSLVPAAQYSVCSGATYVAGVQGGCNDLSPIGGGVIAANAPATVSVTFVTERVVSAGRTKTYRLDCSATGAAAAHSITFKLLDDSAVAIQTDTLTNVNVTANHFIWSDNSSDTHSSVLGTTSADWSNGNLVKTLPTISQTLSL